MIEHGIATKGYLLYFWDTRHTFESKLIAINEIKSEIEITNTEEMFRLGESAFYIDGLPVWIIKRGFPMSINWEFLEEIVETKDKKKIKGTLKTLKITSDEFYSLMKSSYKNLIFKHRYSSKEFVVILILSIAFAVAMTFICTSFYYNSILTEVNNASINTAGVLNGIIR